MSRVYRDYFVPKDLCKIRLSHTPVHKILRDEKVYKFLLFFFFWVGNTKVNVVLLKLCDKIVTRLVNVLLSIGSTLQYFSFFLEPSKLLVSIFSSKLRNSTRSLKSRTDLISLVYTFFYSVPEGYIKVYSKVQDEGCRLKSNSTE